MIVICFSAIFKLLRSELINYVIWSQFLFKRRFLPKLISGEVSFFSRHFDLATAVVNSIYSTRVVATQSKRRREIKVNYAIKTRFKIKYYLLHLKSNMVAYCLTSYWILIILCNFPDLKTNEHFEIRVNFRHHNYQSPLETADLNDRHLFIIYFTR